MAGWLDVHIISHLYWCARWIFCTNFSTISRAASSNMEDENKRSASPQTLSSLTDGSNYYWYSCDPTTNTMSAGDTSSTCAIANPFFSFGIPTNHENVDNYIESRPSSSYMQCTKQYNEMIVCSMQYTVLGSGMKRRRRNKWMIRCQSIAEKPTFNEDEHHQFITLSIQIDPLQNKSDSRHHYYTIGYDRHYQMEVTKQ